jgi:probable HAF family extracellular repeat protein
MSHGFLLSRGIFSTIDVPEATFTEAFKINSRGDIVGTYDSADARRHGFLFSRGSFTTIDVPGATLTAAFGINPRGDIVGRYISDGVSHGYLLSKLCH